MMRESLFNPDRAYGAFLGWWVRGTADRVARRAAYELADPAAAREVVRAYALLHAQRAKMPLALAEPVADREFDEAYDRHLAAIDGTLQKMIAAASAHLAGDRRDTGGAARIAADIARRAAVPPRLVESAMRIAIWQQRKKA